MNDNNKITITFSTSEEKAKLLKLMTFFVPSVCGELYKINSEELQLFAHSRNKYKVKTTNSDARKETAGEKAISLQAQGWTLKKIAEHLTDDIRYSTSRGKDVFHSETVKRLISEQHKNKVDFVI